MRSPDSWEFVFMNMVREIAKKSKDSSTQCGAVIVSKDNEILSLGFNGPPPQIDDEKVLWEERRKDRPNKYDFIIHAEENAILFAERKNLEEEIFDSTVYVTTVPCASCVLRMIKSGIKKVIYDDKSSKPKCVDNLDSDKTSAIIQSLKSGFEFKLIPFSEIK